MNRLSSPQTRFTPMGVFLWGLIILVVATLIIMPFTGGKSVISLLHSNPTDTFMDFFNSIHDAAFDNPYTARGVIYPPLTYLYYRLCGMALPPIEPSTDPNTAWYNAHLWQSSQSGMILVAVTTVLSYLLLIHALLPRERRMDPSARRLTFWVVLGTVPFWYAIERGNLIILTLAFLAYFVSNYKSENPVRRELALVSLAAAVSFKIYPVLFGLLLLKDKKFFAALRCAVYGIVLIFVPFIFFGGLDSALVMVNNILNTSSAMTTYGWGYKVDLGNTLSFMAACLHTLPRLTRGIKFAFILITVLVFLFSKKDWQRYMALSAAMIIFPGFSYTYTLVFAAIPLLVFLREKPAATTFNLLYAFLFLGMFAPFPLGGAKLFEGEPANFYQLNLTTIISSFSILAMLMAMAVDTVIGSVQTLREKKHLHPAVTATADWSSLLRFLAIVMLLLAGLSAFCLYSNHLYNLDIMPL